LKCIEKNRMYRNFTSTTMASGDGTIEELNESLINTSSMHIYGLSAKATSVTSTISTTDYKSQVSPSIYLSLYMYIYVYL
jgi:hypothetical protein